MIRILLVDDQKILLDGLARLLEPYEDLEVVGQLPFSEMVETACGRLKPHVVLMDICMEGKTSGIECTRKIKKHFPQIKVIIMTGFQDVHFVELAQEAGADSFIYKESAADQFVDCIHRTMEGEHLFPDVQERTTFGFYNATLTQREIQILHLSADILDAAGRLEMEPLQHAVGLIADGPQMHRHVLLLAQCVFQGGIGHGGHDGVRVRIAVSGNIDLVHA